ncbi:MAG: hypothetical protein VZR11_08165 [Succinimonas sp.]|nr:hypothetical protein [Succinimonas sp.]
MSNHEIGEAMSSLGTDIIKLYEAGKISKEAARSLIGSCMCIVSEYDGNEYEATESIADAGYCGLCFEKHEDLSDVFNNDDARTLRIAVTGISRASIISSALFPDSSFCTITSALSARLS